jgi:hypothetical protein
MASPPWDRNQRTAIGLRKIGLQQKSAANPFRCQTIENIKKNGRVDVSSKTPPLPSSCPANHQTPTTIPCAQSNCPITTHLPHLAHELHGVLKPFTRRLDIFVVLSANQLAVFWALAVGPLVAIRPALGALDIPDLRVNGSLFHMRISLTFHI